MFEEAASIFATNPPAGAGINNDIFSLTVMQTNGKNDQYAYATLCNTKRRILICPNWEPRYQAHVRGVDEVIQCSLA
jgi:hypothetical protein